MGKIITVDFRQDTLFAVERDDGVFVAIKPICDSLGLGWGSQYNRLQRDPILAEGIFTTKMPSVGGAQETTLLRLDLVNGWLFTIEEGKIKDAAVREKVLTATASLARLACVCGRMKRRNATHTEVHISVNAGFGCVWCVRRVWMCALN